MFVVIVFRHVTSGLTFWSCDPVARLFWRVLHFLCVCRLGNNTTYTLSDCKRKNIRLHKVVSYFLLEGHYTRFSRIQLPEQTETWRKHAKHGGSKRRSGSCYPDPDRTERSVPHNRPRTRIDTNNSGRNCHTPKQSSEQRRRTYTG